MVALFRIGCFLLWVAPVLAWNATGHRLIAQIAYSQLSRVEKQKISRLNQELNRGQTHPYNLVNAAVWLDRLYFNPKLASIKAMHYIDIPFSDDGTALVNVPRDNIVWAIQMANRVLLDKHQSKLDRSIALRILLHTVGDIHQPLHTVTRVSAMYPEGDRGGNLFRLAKNRVAPNLHAYWDKGGGYLSGPPMRSVRLRSLANQLIQRMPCSTLPTKTDPVFWANESQTTAIQFAYTPVLKTHSLSELEQQKIRRIVMRQLTLAGCRLAEILRQV